MKLLLGILLMAFVATSGDFVWYEFGVRHRMAVGILHGALLLMAAGGVIGAAAGRIAAGLPIGAAAGIGGALAYYALAPVVGGTAMIIAWAVVWILLAFGDGRLLRRERSGWSGILLRGALAAVTSGLTFFAVVDLLWGRAQAGGRNYLIQFLAWAIAWAPGILAIALRPTRKPAS